MTIIVLPMGQFIGPFDDYDQAADWGRSRFPIFGVRSVISTDEWDAACLEHNVKVNRAGAFIPA